MKYAKVAVEGLHYVSDMEFDYLVPLQYRDALRPGMRVLVPFGRGNARRRGIVTALSKKSDYDKPKPITRLCDTEPVLSAEMLSLVRWMSRRTFTSLYDCAKAVLPTGLGVKLRLFYSVNAGAEKSDAIDHPQKKRAVEYILSHRNLAEQQALLCELGDGGPNALRELCRDGVLSQGYDSERGIGDREVRMVSLAVDEEEAREYLKRCASKNPKHVPVVEFLIDTPVVSQKELIYMTGCSQSVIKTLNARGIVNLYYDEVYRRPYAKRQACAEPLSLSAEQAAAAEGILERMRVGFGVSLLYGVTGSGKTHVFYRLIDEVTASGRAAILMVPEISIASQTLDRLFLRYGDRVAVMHSGLSIGERLDEWKKIRTGKADVVVGTRSAVFAPAERIGLIIMDEEQEHTYKSESAPRYHAREAAMFRCKSHNAQLVLASATPSIESYYQASRGRYALFTLTKRYNQQPLPYVIVSDMRKELRSGNKSVLSRELVAELSQALSRGEQAILFLNRRGTNTFVSCRACGYVETCDHCSIALTYHQRNDRVMCHYCGFSKPAPGRCPDCDSEHIRYFGTGTQKAESDLSAAFPEALVLRMDADTTTRKFAHDRMLSAFREHEYDILLGTQMVTKGLDFENVTLVGVLAADLSLYTDDFRANERTFSLITQVCGRAGRGDKPGKALIQTYSPSHKVLELAFAQDYPGFYEEELKLRRAVVYPPFCDLCQVVFTCPEAETALKAAELYKEELLRISGSYGVKLMGIGPAPCAVAKVNGRYRYKLIIKSRANEPFLDMTKALLRFIFSNSQLKDVLTYADINPLNIQ